MRTIYILVLISNILFALDITKAEEVTHRERLFYKKFETKLFTGLGNFKEIESSTSCGFYLVVAEIEKGKLEGTVEIWTCDGKLISRMIYLNNKPTFKEAWNEQGKKISNLSYSKEGKPLNGFEKHDDLIDLTYKNGKKSGYEIEYNKDYTESYKVYYEDGKVIKKIKKD